MPHSQKLGMWVVFNKCCLPSFFLSSKNTVFVLVPRINRNTDSIVKTAFPRQSFLVNHHSDIIYLNMK